MMSLINILQTLCSFRQGILHLIGGSVGTKKLGKGGGRQKAQFFLITQYKRAFEGESNDPFLVFLC